MPGASNWIRKAALAGLVTVVAATAAGAGERVWHTGDKAHVIRGASSKTVYRPKLQHRRQILPFNAIINELARAGYSDIRLTRRSGDYWYVAALRNNGAIYRLKIRQRDGRIVSRSRTGWSRVPVPGSHDRF